MHVDPPAPFPHPRRVADAVHTLVNISEPGIILPGPVVTCPVLELGVGSPLLLGTGLLRLCLVKSNRTLDSYS
jgi:hypothetical protein